MKSEKAKDNSMNDFENNFKYWIKFLSTMPRRQLILSIFYGISRIALSAVWPFLLYDAVKNIGNSSFNEILIKAGYVLVILVIVAIISQAHSKINVNILKSATFGMINQVWIKINALEWLTFHSKNRVYYFDVMMNDVWRVRAGMSALLETLSVNILISAALSLFIAFINWPLFLLCLCALFVIGIGYYLSALQIRPLLKTFHDAWRAQHLWIAKSIDQYDLIKMGRAYEESAKMHEKNSDIFLSVNSKVLLMQAKWRNINQLIGNISRIVVFIIGAYWVHIGFINLDHLLLTLIVVTVIQTNVIQIPGALNSFVEAQEALQNMSVFFRMHIEDNQRLPPIESLEALNTISIQNLSFGYTDKKILSNLHLQLEVGKIYLWHGKNGSGKSTVAHILLGLLQPKNGVLNINGKNASWDNLKRRRNRFSFLNQDSPVFMGSVKENTLFGHTQPEEAWNSLNESWLFKLMPISFDPEIKMVGDQGEGLSGGEAKRIALIRELLRSSELLILDEPLNHLDEFAIEEIKREILNIKKNTIIIIISHQAGFEDIADEITRF